MAGVVAWLVVDGVTDSETCPLSLVAEDVVSSGPGDVEKKEAEEKEGHDHAVV